MLSENIKNLRKAKGLSIMNDGEHWFHTDKQMEFLDNWIRKSI